MTLDPLLGKGRISATGVRTNPPASRGWLNDHVILDHRRWVCEEADLTWSAPAHVLILTRRGGTAQTSITCADETRYHGIDRPGALSFVPAHMERDGHYRRADLTYTALWIDPKLTERLGLRNEALPTLLNQRDATIATALQTFQHDHAAGVDFDSGYVEHLAGFLLHRLAQLGRTKPTSRTHARLSPAVLRRIADYIDAHLADEIALQQLADVARLPVDTFARRFKASTGIAPYAFILEHRIRHAEALLSAGRTSIAAVAARAGFCSQSHFSGTFKRLRGITPAAFARANPES
jgi:AraC family transcriptional regulator